MEDWGLWGPNQGKLYDCEVTGAHLNFIGRCFDSSLLRKSLSVKICPEARAWELLLRRGEGEGAFGRERAFLCPGGVPRQHSGRLWVRVLQRTCNRKSLPYGLQMLGVVLWTVQGKEALNS